MAGVTPESAGTGRYVERPVVLGRHGTLVGVLATPAEAMAERPTVVMLNSGIVHRVGPNRLYVTLARRLADAGVASLRFDLSGIGDSPAVSDPGDTAEQITDRDITDALEYLDEAGLGEHGYVPLGICSGADNAYRTAVGDRRVVGAAMMDPDVHRTVGYYVRHVAKRITRRETWRNVLTLRHPWIRRALARGGEEAERAEAQHAMSATSLPPKQVMRDQLRALVERDVRLFYLFTAGLEMRYNYREQLLDAFPDVDFAGRLTLEFFGDSDHTFSQPGLQDRFLQRFVAWATTESFAPPGDRGRVDPRPGQPMASPR